MVCLAPVCPEDNNALLVSVILNCLTSWSCSSRLAKLSVARLCPSIGGGYRPITWTILNPSGLGSACVMEAANLWHEDAFVIYGEVLCLDLRYSE